MTTTVTLQNLRSRSSQSGPASLAVRPEEILELPLFHSVEPDLVNQLAPHFAARQYRSGAKLIQQGEKVSRYRIICSGIVELCRTSNKHHFGVLLLSAKDLVMPSAAAYGESTLVTVIALTTTKTVEVDSEILAPALESSARLSSNLMKAISGQWRMSVRHILDLNSRTAAQRLGSFLLRLADLQVSSTPPHLPIPKRHLASRLGITPETLSRTLQIVADNGLHLRGREIIVRDRAAIEEFCGPDPYERSDERGLNVYAL